MEYHIHELNINIFGGNPYICSRKNIISRILSSKHITENVAARESIYSYVKSKDLTT